MNITHRNYNSSWRRLLAATFALWACISALPWASALPSPITVNAGLDQTAVTGSYVQLWGYRELGDNVDNGQDTYLWEQLEGPDVTLLQGSSFAFGLIKFNAPEVDAVTDLVFRLTITDGEDQSTDEVKIVVYPIPDLGVEGVEFEIGDMQLTDTFGAGETFIRDIHPSNSELSRPVFEFAVAQSQLKDQAFYDNGNIPSAGIYPTQAGDWVVHNKAHLSFHYTDVTIRPNLEYLGSNPNGVSFLIWDRKDWSDGEDEHPIVFGVNGEIKVVQTLKELNGLKLGGTRISIVGAEDYVDPGQGWPIGRSRGLVSVVGAPIEKFVIGAGTSIDVDHIYPAAPAWAQPGLIAEAGLGQDVHTDQVIQLNGTLSTQSNDGSITYQWTQVDPDIDVVISDADSLQPTFIAPEVPDGFIVLTFQLTASEGAVSDQDTVDIKVFPYAVDANAGADQEVEPGELVIVDGSQSSGSSEPLKYSWSQLEGPQITIADIHAESFSFHAPMVDETQVIILELMASLGGIFSTDTVEITVVPALVTANAGVDQTALEGSYVQLTGSNEGPGIEGSFNTYQWEQQSGPQIEVDGGGLMSNQTISFYAPNVDQITELTFDLSVTNGGVTSTDSVTVEVYPIEDLGANCVNFDMGAALTSESYVHGETFIHDTHSSDPNASNPLFEFEVFRSGLYDQAFFDNGNMAAVYVSPGYADQAVHQAKYLYWQFADIEIRPNPQEFDVSPTGISFLIRDTDYERAENFTFGVNGQVVEVSELFELHGLNLGGAQITVIGGRTLNSVSMITVFGAPIDELEIGGGSKLQIDHICTAAPSWVNNGAIVDGGNGDPDNNGNQEPDNGGDGDPSNGGEVVGSDCEFYYLPGINFVEGPPEGGSPDPFSAPAYEGAPEGETWKPDYVKAKYDLDLLGHMMSADFGGGIGEPYPALDYDTITFEPSNGWATVMGDDDRMAGDGAPYAGAEYTSAAGNFSGSYADGDARGTVVYSTGDNSVTFELINLGNSAVGGDMSNADTDRGVNMTSGGNHFLEIPVSETQTGGLKIIFENPVPAAGMYVMGMEQGKRLIEITLTLANGDVVSGHEPDMGGGPESFRGQLDVGGVGLIAYRALSNDPECYIREISLMQPFNEGDTAAMRDIFSVEHVTFASSAPNPIIAGEGGGEGAGTPEDCEDAPLVVDVEFNSDTVGAESSHSSLVHSTTPDWTVVEDSGVKYYESTASQTNLKVEFPSTITLANGEALRVKVDYQYMSPPTDPGTQPFNFLRFGAYHDQGTSDYGDDVGYLADVSYWQQNTDPSATKTGDYAVRKEDNFYNDFDLGPLLDNRSVTEYQPPLTVETGDIVTMFDASGMRATWPKPADEGTSAEHAAVLCLVNVDGTLEARLFHGFPVTYIGSGVESGADVQLSFNSIYLESPSDNTGFRVRRIAAQHVPVTLDCCEPDTDTPEDPSDCILTFYDNRDDGPAGGGEPDPSAIGWSYPNAQSKQTQFLTDLAARGLTHELITFEQVNGWSPVNGTGDMFAGAGAPYAGGAYTSAAFNTSGSMTAGDATGSVAYIGADNTVTFSLYDNGHSAGLDEPGIGDMDGTNDMDRGINTTPGGDHFLEVLPSENAAGGLTIEFNTAVPAVGMYLMGVEDDKRAIEVVILHNDGSTQVRTTDVSVGPHNEGGTQFVGYLAPDLEDNTCWIKRITFNEVYDGETGSDRDIFAIDDMIYPAREVNPPVDTPEDCEDAPLVVDVEFNSDTVGAESSHSSLVHSTTPDWTVVEDSGVKYYESTASQTNLKVEFPSTITLANGEALRVKVDYQYMSPPTDPGTQPFNFLRFGAYHDQGTSDYGDDVGYLADVSYWQQNTDPSATKTGDYAVRKEDNFYNDFDLGPLLDNRSVTEYQPPLTVETGDIVTMFDASGMRATWPKPADEGTSAEHAAVLCLVNVDGTLEARLFHGFPVTYIGSGVESGADVQLSFNSIYLESPSDNTGFRVRRIAAQHVPVTLDCCEPDTDTPEDPSDCILTFYDNRDDGPAGGGEPDPLGAGWSYPNAQSKQTQFLTDLAALGLTYELITFEQVNGWSPVNGTGDMFAGAGAPYAGGAYTSAAFNTSGSMTAGDATGSVAYIGADNTVTFSLYDNGHSAGLDEPGIGDMDGTNDMDRGINTTPGGYHFLEVLPSENAAGGLTIEFNTAVPAVGMYLMGVEDDKRAIEVVILYNDGSTQVRTTDVSVGPHNEGGTQFVGYLAPDLEDNTCWIKRITFNEVYDGESGIDRDIFAIDDVIYPAREVNPPVDTPEDCEDAPLVVDVEFNSDTVGAQSSHSSLVHSSTPDWTVVEDSGVKYYESTSSQTNLKVEFPSTITLANGEALRVKVDYQYMSPPTDPGIQPFNFLRFGAYHDQGTSDYGDDVGYLADVSYWQQNTDPSATKTGDYAVRKEDNFYDDFDRGPLLDNRSVTQWEPPLTVETGDIVTMFDASGMRATWPKPADEGTSAEHAAVLCLVNVDGTLEARLFHGFPVTYIGSGVESGADVQLSFNSIYLESPSDNAGFRVRRIAAQYVPVTLDCCEPDTDPPSDCILTFYDNRDDGPTGGGEPDPSATGWSYPNAQSKQTQFLTDLATRGLTHELITFEQVNGWSPVNGTGDMFAGAGAPYAGGAYTSVAFNTSGSMTAGDATGSVSYIGADNAVTFSLYDNGHSASVDEPGIGDMDGSNDMDRGINTTPGGYHFLEVLPSENATGGLTIEFNTAVPAVGMYLMGVEDDKRAIEVVILHNDGSTQVRTTDVSVGPHNEGGTQFVGYLAPDLEDNTCWIKRITFNEVYDGESGIDRDIFAIDDVIYPAREVLDTIDVGGQVTLFGDGVTPISGATVTVQVGSSSYETITDNNGEYIMTVPSAGDYIFSARLPAETRANKGVDVTDIILLRKHILNREKLPSAMSWVGADPTRDNSIDVADIVEMRKVILNRTSSFSKDSEGKPEDVFRFVKLGFRDTEANLSFDAVADAEFIGFEGTSGSLTGVDFAGVKLGDVNSDWKPSASNSTTQSALPLAGYRPMASALLHFGQMHSNNVGQLKLPVYASTDQELYGIQFEMNWDRSVFAIENITSSILPGFSPDSHVNIGDGSAKVAWDDAMLSGVELNSNQPLLILHLSRLSEGPSGFELEAPLMAGAGGSLGLIQPASIYLRPDGTARSALSGAIKSIELHGSQVRLLVDTKEGQHYQLQATQDLENPSWQNLIELEGSSAWQEVILHAEASSAFLRLVPIEAVIR